MALQTAVNDGRQKKNITSAEREVKEKISRLMSARPIFRECLEPRLRHSRWFHVSRLE
jgi:hypothetical protein